MKSKLNHLFLILVICSLCPIVLGNVTNSRYYSQISTETTPQLASTYFAISEVDNDTFDISPGQSITVQYQLTNKIGSNINNNNLRYYLNLLDSDGNEATKVIITSIGGSYSYTSGKGYGPISLEYDGETEDTKTFDITISGQSSLTTREVLNYKIQVYAENINDTSVYTTKEDNINFNVILYQINYVLNGGTNNSDNPLSYVAGDIITLEDPTKEGYCFEGWYENSSFTGNGITEISGRTEDITLYAKWVGILYFQVPPDWTGGYYAFLYNATGNNAAWPGKPMTIKDSTKNIYQYKFENENPEDYTSLIVVNANNSTRQTMDIAFSTELLGKVWTPEIYKSSTKIRAFGYNSGSTYLYLWNSSTGAKNAKWPGVEMSTRISGSGTEGFIDLTDSKAFNKIIYNHGSGSMQTNDLDITSAFRSHQDLTFRLDGNKIHRLYRHFYKGSWHSYDTWIDSEYSVWLADDGSEFAAAQTDLGY